MSASPETSPPLRLPETLGNLTINKILIHSVTNFDIYIKSTSGLILYAPAPYSWERDELARLSKDGHGNFYYSTSDQSKVEAYLKLTSIRQVDKNLAPKERILNITDVASELTKVLYDYPLTSSALRQGENVAAALVECLKEDLTCVNALGLLAHHDHYTYHHSGRVAAYALAVALRRSLNDQAKLEELALGCVLHDVGKSKIPLEILQKRDLLTESEWITMRQHPVFGHDIIDKGSLSVVTRHIILHHHERLDGSGYPYGLGRQEILPEVSIAAFADVFDALTTNRPYHQSKTKYEALNFIRFKLLHNLDKEVFKALVDILK